LHRGSTRSRDHHRGMRPRQTLEQGAQGGHEISSQHLAQSSEAAEFCKEQEGLIEFRMTDHDNIRVCVLLDGSECEEWAYFRNACAAGETRDEWGPDSNVHRYHNRVTGFVFEYPAQWTLDEEPHRVILSENDLTVFIEYRVRSEDVREFGMGPGSAGDWVPLGHIPFMHADIELLALSYEDKIKAVVYRAPGGIIRKGLEFAFTVVDFSADYDAIDVSTETINAISEIIKNLRFE
jgi:putative hemolysin